MLLQRQRHAAPGLPCCASATMSLATAKEEELGVVWTSRGGGGAREESGER